MAQENNQAPWLGNLYESFGFQKQENPTAQVTVASSTPAWQQPETLWGLFSHKPNTPLQPTMQAPSKGSKGASGGIQATVDSVFPKLIQAESRGQHTDASGKLTTSNVGAKGITQVMPASGKDPGYGVAPLKDESEGEYLRFGKELLTAYTKEFGGDIAKGLAAYNWGPGALKKAIAKHGDSWRDNLPKETASYLTKILGSKTTSLSEKGEPMSPSHKGNESLFNRELSYLLKRTEDNPEFQSLHGFLKSRNAVPKLEAEFASGNKGSFNYEFDPKDPGTVRVGGTSGLEDSQYFRGNDSAIVQPRATLIHEMTHAADRQIGSLVGELVNKKERTPLENQLVDAWDKTFKVKSNKGKSSFDSAKIAQALDAKWFEDNRDYRTTRTEMPAQALGAVSGATNMPGQKAKPHVDTTVATDFLVLLDLAQRVTDQNKKDK